MAIKEYGYRAKGAPGITDCFFKRIDETYVDSIIYQKDTIVETLTSPTCTLCDRDLDFIDEISVRENGVVFDIHVTSSDDREPCEYARIYFFNNGDIHLVYSELSSFNWGTLERDDNLIDELDEKLGSKYELVPEKMFVEEIFDKTKPRNIKMMEECKKQIATVLDKARKLLDDEIFNEDEGINSPIKESHTRINTLVYKL